MFPATPTAVAEPQPSRRRFLVLSAAVGAGLTLGLPLPGSRALAAAGINPFAAYLRIAPDGWVTVYAAHMDMGQGCHNGIATLVAEELDADWSRIRVEGGAGNPAWYGNMVWGGKVQGTGGSTAMASSFERYRRAGAAAKAMLATAAANAWGVPASEIIVHQGIVSHSSGKRAGFGELADAAARLPVPAEASLKQPQQWTLIGNAELRRLDSAAKSNGRQQFTVDLRMPDMLVGAIAHPPLFGARLKGFDAQTATAVAGVVAVVPTSRGPVVLAKDSWSAIRGRDALAVRWDDSSAEKRGTEEILAEYRTIADRTGDAVAADRGDANAALAGAAKVIEATYVFPYLAHAALEPPAAVVARTGDVIEVWGGHQMPDLYQAVTAKIAGVALEKVHLHVMKTGGSFGRRAVPDADIIVEAVEAAKAIDFRAPVKIMWTRENDFRAGRYRPMMLHRVRVGLGADGAIAGWQHRIVGQSILTGTPFEKMMVTDGVDATSVEGVADTRYAIPNFRAESTNTTTGVPVLWWRSVGHTHTAYVMETMIDEVAVALGQDPVAFRLALLDGSPRHKAVLALAAQKAGWGTPLPAGRTRGVAVHESFRTAVAQVAEISTDGKGGVKVERVVCAVDCGVAINPDQIRAQMEGGIGFGLGAILREAVTMKAGDVETTNYDAYFPLRIEEMPKVEVHIVPSSAPPTGAGEPGVPPIGPAVANAVAAATGKRLRTLPLATNLKA